MRRHNVIRSKADVQTSYHQSHSGQPMLNIKVWTTRDDIECAARQYGSELAEPLFLEWLRNVATDEQLESADSFARELGWEMATDDAANAFPNRSVKVWSAGRSGGWLVVNGLPDVADWDAIQLGQWRQYAKWVDATVADHAYRVADILRHNQFESWVPEPLKAIG
jgi:hypothetical protein